MNEEQVKLAIQLGDTIYNNTYTSLKDKLERLEEFRHDVAQALGLQSHHSNFADSYLIGQIEECVKCADRLAGLEK